MIPKFRAWHKELERLMSVQIIWLDESEISELELNDSLMNESIPVYRDEVDLMQSTGGNDKYDEEIFEGDIVGEKDDASTYGVVTYDPNRLMFRVYGKDFDDALSDYWDCEIIGNIYENPELVEEADE